MAIFGWLFSKENLSTSSALHLLNEISQAINAEADLSLHFSAPINQQTEVNQRVNMRSGFFFFDEIQL